VRAMLNEGCGLFLLPRVGDASKAQASTTMMMPRKLIHQRALFLSR
jgi:hypothetical protein